jgi:hypothetical protein
MRTNGRSPRPQHPSARLNGNKRFRPDRGIVAVSLSPGTHKFEYHGVLSGEGTESAEEKYYNVPVHRTLDSMISFFLRAKKASVTKPREINC